MDPSQIVDWNRPAPTTSVRLPNGLVVNNVPTGIKQGELLSVLRKNGVINESEAREFARPRSATTYADDARGLLSGLTLGWGDELRAGYDALMKAGAFNPYGHVAKPEAFVPAYRQGLEEERATLDRFRALHPVRSMAEEVGGGIVSGMAAGGALSAGPVGAAYNNAPLLGRMGIASAGGATGGAVSGAGEARSTAEIPEQAAQAAKFGAIAGPVAELGASMLRAPFQRTLSPQRSAERRLRRALRRSDMTPRQVEAQMRKLGPDAMLADVAEGFRAELDNIVNQPGTARTKTLKALASRATRQHEEILSATGPGQYQEALQALKQQRQQMGSPLYERAFRKGVKHNDELETIFKGLEDTYPGVWNEAKRIGKLDFLGSGKNIPDLGDARPSLLGWQSMKEAIDDKIGSLYKANRSKEAGKLTALKHRMLKELDRQNGDYAAARELWAGNKQFEDAVKDGIDFMKPSNTASQFQAQWGTMSDVERMAYREGARQAIQDTVEKAGYTHDAAKYFRSPSMTKKIYTLFGRREGARILRRITASQQKKATYNRARGNSLTALRQASAAEDSAAADMATAAMDVLTATPSGAGTGIARRMAGMLGPREATRNAIAEMLTSQDPMQNAQILGWLSQGGRPLPPIQGAGPSIPFALGSVGGLLSEPAR